MAAGTKVSLITYPDSLGGNLPGLERALDDHFPGLFGGIHILPPFPSSGDRGFAPLTYEQIDPQFGSWDDIARLAARYELTLDLMVNHISARSPQFADFLALGRDSVWADLFIGLDKIWPDGQPRQADLDQIFLRRERPWSTYEAGHPPQPVSVWTTFGKTEPSQQVDIDWRSPAFRTLIEGFFERFASHGIKTIRLDAVGYLVKRAGTSCFMVEPETDQLLDWLERMARRHGVRLLPEVHSVLETQRRLACRGRFTYDFVLPYRVLEALVLRRPERLAVYLADRPANQVTTLDCHDGIPVKPDVDGLYDPNDVRRVVATCLDRGGNLSRIVSPRHQDPDSFDVHQVRGTLYSLLGCDDDAYIAARAVQLFAPGLPQIYYVGLMAGKNDQAAAERTGDGRDINRHNYSADEIAAAAGAPVVGRLARLIRLRNEHPAFKGDFEVSLADGRHLGLRWQNGPHSCLLCLDFKSLEASVTLSCGQGGAKKVRIADGW